MNFKIIEWTWMYKHQAFQLTIDSELMLPELFCLDLQWCTADVTIRYGGVDPQGLENPIRKERLFQAKENQLWLEVPGVARFLVIDGARIIIDPVLGIDEASIRVFLLGSCLGALLMQRGLLLLHGSTIQVGEYAVTFVGRSGAGKSTLAGAFLKRGYALLSDDVCAIDEHHRVIPGFPQLKLWADAAMQLDFETSSSRKIRPELEKYGIPLGESFCVNVLPLQVVYILHAHDKNDVTFANCSGIDKFKLLREQTYRLAFVKGLAQESQHRMQCGRLANQIMLAQITRPQQNYSLEQLTLDIEADLANRGVSTKPTRVRCLNDKA